MKIYEHMETSCEITVLLRVPLNYLPDKSIYRRDKRVGALSLAQKDQQTNSCSHSPSGKFEYPGCLFFEAIHPKITC